MSGITEEFMLEAVAIEEEYTPVWDALVAWVEATEPPAGRKAYLAEYDRLAAKMREGLDRSLILCEKIRVEGTEEVADVL